MVSVLEYAVEKSGVLPDLHPSVTSPVASIMEHPVGLVLCGLSVYSKVYAITHMEVPCYEQFSIEYCAA